MLTENFDFSQLLNADSPYLFKTVKEDLFEMGQTVKQALDAGVAPDDFNKLEALSNAINTAQEVLLELQE